MGAVLGLPGDQFWISAHEAFVRGYLDVPFAPHATNANELLTIRDAEKAIRILDPGRVPMRPEDAAAEKAALARHPDPYDSVVEKILRDIHIMT
jgi:glutamate mutase epsilon subunit